MIPSEWYLREVIPKYVASNFHLYWNNHWCNFDLQQVYRISQKNKFFKTSSKSQHVNSHPNEHRRVNQCHDN